MRTPLAITLTALTVMLVLPSQPRPIAAEATTSRPGAILVFPKILSDDTHDTIIQITNATGSSVQARCFYLDGRVEDGDPDPVWLATDFQIALTRLQPTVWVASEGLPAVAPDRPLDLHPGPVPPVGEGFIGELRCIVVSSNEAPIARNAIVGTATLVDRTTQQVSKYHAVALRAVGPNNGDNVLLLNNEEYSTCPRVLILNHFFDAAPDPVLNTEIQTQLTFIPCSVDLEQSVPGTAVIQFEVYNEFEQQLSANMEVTCFAETGLSSIDSALQPHRSIFNFALQGTLVGQTRIRPVPDASMHTGHGVLAIAEEMRPALGTSDSLNLHLIGGHLQADVMVLSNPF